jgi:outer membrane protein OmpA-like peptidoglycan-associated protein
MTAAAISPSDAELGFKPSSAPPLDPSVSQFVAAPIVNHYRRSAANAGYVQTASAAVPAKKARRAAAMGGPETMTGAVVANLDVLNGGRAVATPVAYSPATASGANAVVYFPGDIVSLNAEAKAQIRVAVEQYKASGGQGYIRVIGHSSSRTPNMTPAKHVELVFKKSQDRASAVAQEIIREGVPAAHVLVEAVGDSQPVYYESMPKGEDGNRRAEIFLQG